MKCPTCRRTFTAADIECSRCGTDLTLLQELDAKHQQLLEAGCMALARCLTEEASPFFHEALRLRADCSEAHKGLALAALIQGDFISALELHSRTQQLNGREETA